MKVLLFILGLALCRGLPILGGYQMVDTTEAQQSSQIQNLIQVGLKQILQAGVQKGDFSSDNFVLSKINSLYRQVLDGENYRFNCDFTNDQNQQLTASFEVKTGGSGSVRTTVSSFSYQVKTVTITQIVSQTFVEVSSSEVQYSTEIQVNLDFGLQQAINRAIQEGKIPNFSYDLLEIKDVSRQVVESALFYKFNCSATNSEGVVIQVTFTVYYQPLLGEQSLADYSCEVEGDTPALPQEQEQETTVEEETTETQTPSTGTGTGTTTEIFQPIENQYVQILVTQVETNQVIKGCLDFGVQQVIQAGANEGKIPGSGFNVSEIVEAYNQILGNGVFYKFTCKLVNTQNVVIQATFTVYYEITTRTNTLASYSYQVLVTGSGGTGSVTSTTTPGTQTTVDEVEEEIETGGTGTTVTETIIPEQEDASTQTDTTVVDVELELGQDTQGGFTSISVEEARENQEVYSNVEFGFNTVIQKGKDSGKIPNTSFSIQILEASVRRGANGDLYKFKCQGTNQEGAVIEMYFTVYYYFSSQRRTLSSYSYFININQTHTPPSQPVEGSFVELSQQEIQSNSEVQNILSYGTSQIYVLGVSAGDIKTSQFSIVSITSVQRKETINGVSYKCEVTSSNQNNVNLIMSFTIFYQSSSQQTILSQYSYRVQEISNPAPPDNTDTDDSYTAVDKSEIDSSSVIKSVIDFGIDYILQQGYKSKKIPISVYQVTNIVSVSRKSERRGVYYKCRVELEDVNDVLITASFTIRDTYDTHEKWVQAWKYHVSNIRSTTKEETKVVDTAYIEVDRAEVDNSNEIKSCLDYGVNQVVSDSNYVVTTINRVERQVIKSALYYKFDIELSNRRNNKIMRLTFTVYYKPDVGDRNVNAYSYSIRTSTTSTSSTSWSTSTSTSTSTRYNQLRTSTVQSSTKYQDIVNFGVRECINKLVNINVVATADFQISQILSAFSQEVSNDENCKFKVKLSNSFGISLYVNFNVKYNKRSGQKTLTSYSVEGSSEAQTDVMVVDATNAQDDEVAVGNCQKVNTAEVESNSNVKEAIDYGVQQVVQAVTREQNTSRDFSVKQIKNVYREIVDSLSYRVEATLVNSRGINVDCSFSISAQASSKQVTSLSYITYQ